jgi:hypothetical protein
VITVCCRDFDFTSAEKLRQSKTRINKISALFQNAEEALKVFLQDIAWLNRKNWWPPLSGSILLEVEFDRHRWDTRRFKSEQS